MATTATKATHTPGPWQWSLTEARDQKLASIGIKGYTVNAVDEGRTVTVADCFPSPWPVVVSEANARLLAAAPDLLAACQEALSFAHTCATGAWEQIEVADRQLAYEDGANAACCLMEAAIAKATS